MVHRERVRVRYAETDQMGIAHHSAYVVWFEVGRSGWLRARGMSYARVEEELGIFLVLSELWVRYHRPARYDQEVTVETELAAVRSRGLTFRYRVRADDGTLLAEGETGHIAVDRGGGGGLRPPPLRRLLEVE